MPDGTEEHHGTPQPEPQAQANPSSVTGPPPETAAQAPTPTPPPPPGPEFKSLDPSVINLWRLQQVISSCILLGLATVIGGIAALANPPLRIWIAAAWGGLLLLRIFLMIWYPPAAYRNRSYRIDDRVLESRRGILFKVITLLPLSRLQHVDLNRGPLERMFGLASLILYTAGTQHAMVVIPGLSEEVATELRDRLVTIGGDDAV